jgi:hypothetical protein
MSPVLLSDKLQGQKAIAFPNTEYHLGNMLQGQNSHRNIQWPGGLLRLESDMKRM